MAGLFSTVVVRPLLQFGNRAGENSRQFSYYIILKKQTINHIERKTILNGAHQTFQDIHIIKQSLSTFLINKNIKIYVWLYRLSVLFFQKNCRQFRKTFKIKYHRMKILYIRRNFFFFFLFGVLSPIEKCFPRKNTYQQKQNNKYTIASLLPCKSKIN